MIQLRFKQLSPKAELPNYATQGSAGFDIKAIDNYCIEPGSWCLVHTGLAVEIPRGYEIQVRSRSGLAGKYGVFVLNSPGTVDSDYRGEISVILFNAGDASHIVSSGERVAQLVLSEVAQADLSFIEPYEELTKTDRGEGGFGSTGR